MQNPPSYLFDKFLNMPLVLNMWGFWIYQGYTELWIYLNIRKNISACLFNVHNTPSLSRHEQVRLMSLNILAYDVINLVHYAWICLNNSWICQNMFDHAWLCQNHEIIQTKMEVGTRFWVPNLGLSPKYDKVTF